MFTSKTRFVHQCCGAGSPRIAASVSCGTSIEDLREAAVAALRKRHLHAYGCLPEGDHAWTDAGAILLVARARAAREAEAGYSLLASLAKLQHAVVAEVYLRTGELLRPGGRSANSERGLLVFAFERVPSSALVVAAAPRATERPR
jgi:hypothetical protein